MFAYAIIVFVLFCLAAIGKEENIIDVLVLLPIFGRIFGWW